MPATIRRHEIYAASTLYALAGGTGTQAAIKTGCCYLSALASGGKVGLKGNSLEGQVTKVQSLRKRGWMSTWRKPNLEIAFLPMENERVHWHVIKKVSLSISLGVSSQLFVY